MAGLDEEQPGDLGTAGAGFGIQSYFSSALKAAVEAGTVPVARLNDMVFRKLRTMIAVGVMDHPPTPGGSVDQAAGNREALAVAHESIVLLKNGSASGSNQPVLPLAADAALDRRDRRPRRCRRDVRRGSRRARGRRQCSVGMPVR